MTATFDVERGDKLYIQDVTLDDLAGASLVSRWSWNRNNTKGDVPPIGADGNWLAGMEGVCIGFRTGSSALIRSPGDGKPNLATVLPLPLPADPVGWHDFPDHGDAPNFRRARLIDIWEEADGVHIESVFQDSCSLPNTTCRIALHEYRLSVLVDGTTGLLLSLETTAGTRPHPECLAAGVNVGILIGTPMESLRETVLEWLKRTAGCTHLNDMIRSLVDVPALADLLIAYSSLEHGPRLRSQCWRSDQSADEQKK